MQGEEIAAPKKKLWRWLFYHEFVQFGKQHSWYKAIFSSIVLSQQCCEVYFISLTVAKPLCNMATKYYWNRYPPNLAGWIRPWEIREAHNFSYTVYSKSSAQLTHATATQPQLHCRLANCNGPAIDQWWSLPFNWKVGCSAHGHCVNGRNAPWARAFTSTAPASRFRCASNCRHKGLR